MRSGTDAANEASDLTLVRSDLRTVADGIRLAPATLRTSGSTCCRPSAYSIVALRLPMADSVNPMLASAAVALSSRSSWATAYAHAASEPCRRERRSPTEHH